MIIVKKNIASIKNKETPGARIQISIIKELVEEVECYFITTDNVDDCGPPYLTYEQAKNAIYDKWGDLPNWDLDFRNH